MFSKLRAAAASGAYYAPPIYYAMPPGADPAGGASPVSVYYNYYAASYDPYWQHRAQYASTYGMPVEYVPDPASMVPVPTMVDGGVPVLSSSNSSGSNSSSSNSSGSNNNNTSANSNANK
jgi:hypothetical protein